jgi:hypothetical protein
MKDRAPLRAEVSEAVLSTVRGGLRILEGMVQMAAGVTRLIGDTAIRAVEAAEEVVETTAADTGGTAADTQDAVTEKPQPKPKPQ